ncbi:UNVERIFIED_CONTAM: hypothetical protein Slati_3522300 [Sesamum latifolium]|uniref:RNase H type-1 domain-containing protein n=1 Tax=Sesamum latifolium TaxID=2727402 RepID=A0AAW2UHU1_9LAMI
MGSRIVKWSYELNEFDMEYHPRGAIKAQALADFMVECPYKETPKAIWELYVDGSATSTLGGGIILIDPEGEKLKFVIRYSELVSNNEAEYETLLVGIRIAAEAGVWCIKFYSDSQLVAEQISGGFTARSETMKKLLEEARKRLNSSMNGK